MAKRNRELEIKRLTAKGMTSEPGRENQQSTSDPTRDVGDES